MFILKLEFNDKHQNSIFLSVTNVGNGLLFCPVPYIWHLWQLAGVLYWNLEKTGPK